MTDASWDDDDFEPVSASSAAVIIDKWGGEDEDDVKDNWEDEDEDEKAAKEEGAVTEPQKEKKKSLKEKIAEKEAKRKAEIEEKRRRDEEERQRMSPEDIAAEKLRQQKLQEDADLELAKAAFGVSTEPSASSGGGLDAISLRSREDFDSFSKALKDKLHDQEHSPHYVMFLEDLLRDLALNLEAEDVKKLASTLNAVANEKVKAQKAGSKGKKKGKGPKVVMDKEEKIVDDVYDEYDDFM